MRHKALKDAVLDCNKHFDTVIKDSRATFASDLAQQAIANWIELVIEASLEIRKLYAKSKTSTLLFLQESVVLNSLIDRTFAERARIAEERRRCRIATQAGRLQDDYLPVISGRDQSRQQRSQKRT